MTTQTADDSIESLFGESREGVLSREETSLEALVQPRNGRKVLEDREEALRASAICSEEQSRFRTYEGDGWQAVAYAVAKQRVLA